MKIQKLLYYFIPFIIFFCDFYSKKMIVKNFFLYQIKPIFIYLNFFYNKNYGGIFGILDKENGIQNIFFSILNIIIIFYLLSITYKNLKDHKKNTIPYFFIIGGALGNLFDRFYYGYVVDFIDIYIKKWHFPTFNIADLFITIGLLWIFIKEKKN